MIYILTSLKCDLRSNTIWSFPWKSTCINQHYKGNVMSSKDCTICALKIYNNIVSGKLLLQKSKFPFITHSFNFKYYIMKWPLKYVFTFC